MSSFQDTQDIVALLSKSAKNDVIALQQNLETTGDLFAALNQMHDVIVNIQGRHSRNTCNQWPLRLTHHRCDFL